MPTKKRLMSGAALVLGGQLVAQGSIFLRNLVVTYVLTKEQFGIAATFALTVTLIEMSSTFSVNQLIIQSKRGDEARFQGAVQSWRFAQGFVMSIVLLLLAPIFATLYDQKDMLWAYRMLAFVPLVNGLQHFDVQRVARKLNYRPEILSSTVSQLGSLLAVCILSYWIKDPTLVLWAVLAQPVILVVMTHLCAARAYRWHRERAAYREIFSFGWPLLLNGIVMLLITQGDRFLIAIAKAMVAYYQHWIDSAFAPDRIFSKADFADYGICAALCQMPIMFVAKMSGLLFPVLSRVQHQQDRFCDYFRYSSKLIALVSAAIGCGFVVAGGAVVELIYPEDYAGLDAIIGWLGVAAAIRMIRISATTAALSLAATKIPLYANMARVVTLVGATQVIFLGLELHWVAVCAFVGELAALLASVYFLKRARKIPMRICLPATIYVLATCAVGAGVSEVLDLGPVSMTAVGIGYSLLAVLAGLVCFPVVLQRIRGTGLNKNLFDVEE